MTEQVITKRCCFCKQNLPYSRFHKCSRNKDGIQDFCIDCNRTYQRHHERKYRQTEVGKTIANRYRKSEKGRKASREKYRRSIIKKRASARVRAKVRMEIMVHPSKLKCYVCKQQATEYHHPKGYSEKYVFYVVPVCFKCHNEIHNPRID